MTVAESKGDVTSVLRRHLYIAVPYSGRFSSLELEKRPESQTGRTVTVRPKYEFTTLYIADRVWPIPISFKSVAYLKEVIRQSIIMYTTKNGCMPLENGERYD